MNSIINKLSIITHNVLIYATLFISLVFFVVAIPNNSPLTVSLVIIIAAASVVKLTRLKGFLPTCGFGGMTGAERVCLFVIILSAVVLRLIVGHYFMRPPASDFSLYWSISGKWLEGTFVNNKSWTTIAYYCLSRLLFGNTLLGVLIINTLSGVLQLLLSFYISGYLFSSNKAGLLSAAVVAFFPPFIVYTPVVSSEAPFGILMLLVIFLFIRIQELSLKQTFDRKLSLCSALLGLVIVLSFWCRGNGLLWAGLVGIGIFLFWVINKAPLAKARILVIAFAGAMFFALSLGALCNVILNKSLRISCDNSSAYVMLFGANVKHRGRYNEEDIDLIKSRYNARYGEGGDPEHCDSRQVKLIREETMRRWKENYRAIIKMFPAKFKHVWMGDSRWALFWNRNAATLQETERFIVLTASLRTYLYLGCMAALLFSIKLAPNRKNILFVMLGFILVNMLLGLAIEANFRYQYPLLVVTPIIFGGCALCVRRVKEQE